MTEPQSDASRAPHLDAVTARLAERDARVTRMSPPTSEWPPAMATGLPVHHQALHDLIGSPAGSLIGARDHEVGRVRARLTVLEDVIERYRKTWAGTHGDDERTATRQGNAECLVCEADRLLGGQTR